MSERNSPRRRASAADQRHDTASGDGRDQQPERRAASFQNVAERFAFGVAKEGLAEELGTGDALLRGMVALQEAQSAAARHTGQAHAEARRQMASARSVVELNAIGLSVLQADVDASLRYWGEAANIASRSAFEAWNEAFSTATRLQTVAQTAALHWMQAAASARPEILESQLEHLTTPLTSSPLVWPAQEAIREAATLSTRGWNDWLGLAVAGSEEAAQAATDAQRH